MKVPSVKGTRDFYPPDMARRNWIIDGWKRISVRNGFEEYDGPIFEYLRMFRMKSGDEIVEQLFSFRDRGGRDLAIRPEITPTLARMVNQKINSLARPIKWFSVPRLCRAERPQKGRLREFFQWNIDIIGVDDVIADAEVIFCAIDYLRDVGLTADDIVVRISSREMLAALLLSIGIEQSRLDSLYAVLDKRSRLSDEDFERFLAENLTDEDERKKLLELMSTESLDRIGDIPDLSPTAAGAIGKLKRLFELLRIMGAAEYCTFDIGIVRGLAYYTGIVFEIYDKANELRAIGGGGRYDDLLKQFGGPAIPATGFGIGDCVLDILLEEKKLLPGRLTMRRLDYFVASANEQYADKAVELAAGLRLRGFSTGFDYKSARLGKQLKQASDLGAENCIIVGSEIEDDRLVIKDMATGNQQLVGVEQFFSGLSPR